MTALFLYSCSCLESSTISLSVSAILSGSTFLKIFPIPYFEIVEVINIGIRRSKFLSEDKKAIVIVPNVDLSKNKIVNFTLIEDNSEKSK